MSWGGGGGRGEDEEMSWRGGGGRGEETQQKVRWVK